MSLLLPFFLGCARPPVAPSPGVRALDPIEAFAAFAQLYGVVRWYHPADEAGAVDWDRAAVDGVAAVRGAGTPDELAEALRAWAAPLGPTVQVWTASEPAPPPLVSPGDAPVVAWQHVGLATDGGGALYRAARVGRTGPPIGDAGEITATNGLEADDWRGRRIRLSARVRVEATAPAAGHLWLRVDHGERDIRATLDGWDEPALRGPAWEDREVEAEVVADATWLVYGVRLEGKGTMWADDLRLAVQEADGRWTALPVREPGFDDGARWWEFDGSGYDADVVEDAGDPVLRLVHQELRRGLLFDELPALGEAFDAPLGAGVVARVPLALPDLGEGPAAPAQARLDPAVDDPDVRVAAAVVAWNVLRHFQPYGAEAPVAWDAVLRDTLTAAAAAPDRAGALDALWSLVVAVPDGHGWVAHPAVTGRLCGAALRWWRVGDELVVTRSDVPEVLPGDRVLAVDGVPTAEALALAERRVSGAPHFRHAFAAERLATGACGVDTALVLEREGEAREVRVARHGAPAAPFDHPGIERLPDGVVVVDLNTVPWTDLEPELPALARAPAVVFDLREYPSAGVHRVLEHLLVEEDDARDWMQVPRSVRPGEVAGYETWDWALQPAEPHLPGRVVFLTSPLAMSAAESTLALVAAHRLGTLFGGPTGGTNGNLVQTPLPGGYGLQFTGMRVVRPGGERLHLIGVPPDVVAEPTLAGLVAGRDEVRDAAIAWVRAAEPPSE